MRARDWLDWVQVGLLAVVLAVQVGLSTRASVQAVVSQSLVVALGSSEARAQIWEARAAELAKQVQALQQPTKPSGK